MELRHYWNILRNAWWLLVSLPVLVAILTLGLAFALPRNYVVKPAMLITQQPIGAQNPNLTLPDQNNWYSWAASEYADDDMLQIVETERFAQDISDWVAKQHKVVLDPTKISKSITSERRHRTVYLTVTAADPNQALWIAQGATQMLQDNGLQYWKRETSGAQLNISVLDPPVKAKLVKGLALIALDVVLRSVLALFLAVGIAFLLHYLDQAVHRTIDVEALGFKVIGAIPGEAKGRR